MSFTSALSRWRTALKALPVAGTLPLAMALASLLPYDMGRSFFVLPILGLLSMVGVMTFTWPKRFGLIEAISLALGLYLGAIFFQLAFIHPELATAGNIKGLISLGMGWSVFVVLTQMPPSEQTIRWIERSLICLTVVVAAQIWVSYFTGWGEVHDTRDGVRRAFGMAGDNLTLVFVFLITWSFLRKKWALGTLALSALFMTGGRLSLALTLISLSLALISFEHTPTKERFKSVLIFCLAIVFSLVAVQAGHFVSKEQAVPPAPLLSTTSAQTTTQATAQAVPAPPPPVVWTPPSDPDSVRGPKPFLERLENLYGAGALGTLRGRLISVGAGYDMFLSAPFTGVGFGQSTPLFETAALADRLQLKEWAGARTPHFLAEKYIANQYLLTAAELGLLGLLPFMAFALCAFWLCVRAYRAVYHTPLSDPRRALALAASLWAGCLIVAGQTVAWFLPASPQTLWLGFTLGLATLAVRDNGSEEAKP